MGLEIDQGDAPGLEAPLNLLANRTADSCKITQTRPNNTTAYTANDVVGVALAAAAGQATIVFTFPRLALALANGGELLITSAELSREVTALISGETNYNLYLFNEPPPSALLDNAAFDISVADLRQLIGKINLGTPVDEGSILLIKTDGINQQVTALSNTIYGYLVTVGAYTPAANTVLNVTLHALAV